MDPRCYQTVKYLDKTKVLSCKNKKTVCRSLSQGSNCLRVGFLVFHQTVIQSIKLRGDGNNL